jgi:outer membrane protein OmpA-like peptidoglycan-associated protein
VTGTGFGDSGKLMLNGKAVATARWSPTSIVFTTPAGGTDGDLTVECDGHRSPPLRFIVAKQNAPPIASGFAQRVPGAARTFILNGTDSTDPDGRITAYVWKLAGKTKKGAVVSFTLKKGRARATVHLTVRDNDGKADTVAIKIHRTIVATIPSEALFDTDSDQLKSAARERLRALRPSVNGARSLYVAGHTDSTASEAYNRDLSRRRALRVRDFLLRGLRHPPPVVLPVGAFGETRPIASNETVAGRAKNRRVVIVIRRAPRGG